MIVQSMNSSELLKEVEKDVEKLRSTTEIRLCGEYDKERRKLKISKNRVYTKMYSVKTASKNNWLLFISKNSAADVYKCEEHASFCYVSYFYNSKGLSVIRFCPSGMELYYGHFFKRYNERMNLGLSNSLDAAKKYFLQGGGDAIYSIVEKEGKKLTIGFSSEGILLGELQNNNRLYVNKTFLSKAIANNKHHNLQKELLAELRGDMQLAALMNTECINYTAVLNAVNGTQRH